MSASNLRKGNRKLWKYCFEIIAEKMGVVQFLISFCFP
jgi:hypothetical protein